MNRHTLLGESLEKIDLITSSMARYQHRLSFQNHSVLSNAGSNGSNLVPVFFALNREWAS